MPPPGFPGLFVAGTDTNVGKTFLACALLHLARLRRLPLIPYKPAESGTKRGLPRDAAALRDAAGLTGLALRKVCPHRFAAPVAPAAATLARGPHLTLPRLLNPTTALLAAVERMPSSTAVAPPALLVEAAGGLLSPYAPTITGADLASALGLPVLLVARNGLGTINHTALAVAECARRGLDVAAIALVASEPLSAADRRQHNAALIARLTGIQPSEVPHFAGPADRAREQAAHHLARSGLGDLLLKAAFAPQRPTRSAPRALRARRRPSSGR